MAVSGIVVTFCKKEEEERNMNFIFSGNFFIFLTIKKMCGLLLFFFFLTMRTSNMARVLGEREGGWGQQCI